MSRGEVTGEYADSGNTYHGYLCGRDGGFTTFDVPGGGIGNFLGTYPWGLNIVGMVTGFNYDDNGLAHGFLRTPDGSLTIIEAPGTGNQGTYTQKINPEAQIAGPTGSYSTKCERVSDVTPDRPLICVGLEY